MQENVMRRFGFSQEINRNGHASDESVAMSESARNSSGTRFENSAIRLRDYCCSGVSRSGKRGGPE